MNVKTVAERLFCDRPEITVDDNGWKTMVYNNGNPLVSFQNCNLPSFPTKWTVEVAEQEHAGLNLGTTVFVSFNHRLYGDMDSYDAMIKMVPGKDYQAILTLLYALTEDRSNVAEVAKVLG